MNTNQKSIAVLSSPYLFAISQVGAALAKLAPVFGGWKEPRPYRSGQIVQSSGSDGHRSTVREDKYCRPNRAYGQDYCGDTVPANRVNRAARRAAEKFARRNPTIKVA